MAAMSATVGEATLLARELCELWWAGMGHEPQRQPALAAAQGRGAATPTGHAAASATAQGSGVATPTASGHAAAAATAQGRGVATPTGYAAALTIKVERVQRLPLEAVWRSRSEAGQVQLRLLGDNNVHANAATATDYLTRLAHHALISGACAA